MVNLRPYQIKAVEAVEKDWEDGYKQTLLVLPTGTGKTICFAEIAKRRQPFGRTLVLAHREELLSQAADKIELSVGLSSSLEKAENHASDTNTPVVVGSVQTLSRDSRLEEYKPQSFGTVIVDEAHHCLSDSYKKVLNYFKPADVLGVTATPDRGDKKNLGEYFQHVAFEYLLQDAVRDGYLVPIKAQTIPLKIDLSDVHFQQGDYAVSELGHALEPYLEQIADVIAEKYSDRKTVVFLPLIAISREFQSLLQERGVPSWEVNGESENRREILEEFDSVKSGVLCNSMLLTEGWDCPSVNCIIVLRPTKIRSLYCQMIGRGTRLFPGKDNLLLLDFLWMTGKHELCRPTCLICENPEVATKINEMMDETGQEIELSDETIETATQDVLASRKNALAQELEKQRKSTSKLVDVLQYEMSIGSALTDYEPCFAWELEDMTPKQKSMIEGSGINTDGLKKGQASKIIEKIQNRRKAGLTTPKQIRCLERFGFRDVGMWKFEDAQKIISFLAQNGWKPYRLPVDPMSYIPKGGLHIG